MININFNNYDIIRRKIYYTDYMHIKCICMDFTTLWISLDCKDVGPFLFSCFEIALK